MGNRIQRICFLLVIFIIIAAICCASAAQVRASGKPVRILFIGNSLTFYYEMPKVLANLANAPGRQPALFTQMYAPGGFTLENNYTKGEALKLIKSGKWDYVVLQDGSSQTIKDREKFFEYSRKFDSEIKKAGAKTIFYMTWGYERSEPNMFSQVAESYKKAAAEVNAPASPVGLAWQRALKEKPGIKLYDNDGVHQNQAGTYLTACVFYITLTGRNPAGFSNGGLTELKRDDCIALQKIAWETVNEIEDKKNCMTEQAFGFYQRGIEQKKKAVENPEGRKDIFEKVFQPAEANSYNYIAYKPKDYDKQKLWPLILFLHGMGERGDDLEKHKIIGLPQVLEKGKDLPFVIICPQCPEYHVWNSERLNRLLDEVIKKYSVDRERIYLTGLSMGGFGSWSLGCRHPERFAAVAPICGGGNVKEAVGLKDVPVWAFHGAKDKTVSLTMSQEMVNAVNKNGGDAKLTVYPEAGHDSWTQTYNNPELYKWFLSHKKNANRKE